MYIVASMVDGPVRTLLRPRRSLVIGWLVQGLFGLPMLVAAVRSTGVARFGASAGVLLFWVGFPIGFFFGSRVRKLTVNSDGLQLSGFLLHQELPWSRVAALDFCKMGPTPFLVVQTTTDDHQPALSPFRRRFARKLEVDDFRSLLVVRTVDFTGGYGAVSEAIHACTPTFVPVGLPLNI